jgi:hypothetical protein
MPSRDVHRPFSAAVGVSFSAYRAHRCYQQYPDPALPIALEMLGGLAGGWLGGALPDWIDPPTSPNHRSFGHGVATVAGAIAWTADAVLDFQMRLRAQADDLVLNRWRLQSDFERTISVLAEFLLRFLAGLLDGLIAGYAAHLALDLCTPKGLPLLARNF